ncbi:MAG: DoxX family protein [Bacteroidota bacterium]
MSNEKPTILDWILRVVAAVILIQTLRFKFTAAPESVYIFETLGLEPYGRIGIGVVELITGILLLIPRTAGIGGVIGMGVMAGAIFSHLTKLGIDVQGDGGLLFGTACFVFLICAIITWRARKQIPILKNFFN